MVKRGDIVWARLNPIEGHEQAGIRPVLVVSENAFNRSSGNVIAFALTSQDRRRYPFQLDVGMVEGRQSFALPAHVRTLSQDRLGKTIGGVDGSIVERCLDAMLQICGRRPKLPVQ